MAKGKSKEVEQLSWHPDFRDVEALPDVKVVRTDFLVNFVAITICVLLLGYLGYRQLNTSDLNSRIADLQEQIEQQATRNRKNLKESGEFKKASKKVEDLGKFFEHSVQPLRFVAAVTESKPEFIAVTRIQFDELTKPISKTKSLTYGVYTIYGVQQGSSSEAYDLLKSYNEIIKSLELLDGKIESADVNPTNRNESLDIIEFDIKITLKPDSK